MLLSVISLLISQGIAQQVQNPSHGLTVMMLSSTSTCTSISVRAVATVEIQGNSLSGSGVINLNQMANSGVINLISAAKSEEYSSSVVVDLTSMPKLWIPPNLECFTQRDCFNDYIIVCIHSVYTYVQ